MKEIRISSPGRINLIGEHTDYNDGFVLPAAIDKRIEMTFRSTGSDRVCTIRSKGFGDVLTADLEKLQRSSTGWHNYILGVLHELVQVSDRLRGFECTMESSVPVGSGVSSSAALECGLAFGLNELFGLGLDRWQLARLGQRAEHHFVGTQCGIMDQFASVMGKAGHAMLLDCRSLEFEYLPARMDPYVILMLNTNVTHNLAESGYNTRREESASGLQLVAERFGTEPSFRALTPEMITNCRKELGDVRYRRCLYVLEENERVLKAAEALGRNDLQALGRLLYASHDGQRHQYEVSCPELDFLVDFSKPEPQILGSRMMGGGFGGCTLNIIHRDAVERYVTHASEAFRTEFGIELSHFVTVPSGGVALLGISGNPGIH